MTSRDAVIGFRNRATAAEFFNVLLVRIHIRLGSTNPPTGPELLAELQRLARNSLIDMQPCLETSPR